MRQPAELLDGLRHELRAAALEPGRERRVDLVEATTRDVDPQVPGEGQHDRLLEARVRVDEHDHVGAVRAADVRVGPELILLIRAQPRSRVASEDEVIADILDARAEVGRLGRCRVTMERPG